MVSEYKRQMLSEPVFFNFKGTEPLISFISCCPLISTLSLTLRVLPQVLPPYLWMERSQIGLSFIVTTGHLLESSQFVV